jgi:hypothetical protein
MGSFLPPETGSSLPDMDACPSSTTLLHDCYLKCGCQCTRCSICVTKILNSGEAQKACR